MKSDDVVDIIRRNELELRKLGAAHLRLFGSVARGTATDASDVDVAVEFADGVVGFARIGVLDGIRDRLMAELGRAVDVVEAFPRSAKMRRAIERGRIAF